MPLPYTDTKMVKKVMSLRKKGKEMPFRLIAESLGKDVKTIYRWYLQGIGKRKITLKK